MSTSRLNPGKYVAGLVLWVACVVTLLPLIWLVVSSFKTNESFLTSLFLPINGDGAIDWTLLFDRDAARTTHVRRGW